MQILLKDNLDVLESLVKVCKEHHAELASRLVHIFLDTDMIIDKLIICNQRVIDKESESRTTCLVYLMCIEVMSVISLY